MIHKKLARPLLPVLLATVGLSGTAWAQGQQEQPRQPQQMPEQEQPQQQQQQPQAQQQRAVDALARIHAINQFESQVALMALNAAQADSVVSFAENVAQSHQQLDRQLLKTANQLDLKVAGSSQAQQEMQQLQQPVQQQLQELTQAEGLAFDRAFLDTMVMTHETAIQQLRGMREQLRNRQMQRLIDRSLRDMEKHLREAREIQQRIQPRQPRERRR